jgi:hypothetical protein
MDLLGRSSGIYHVDILAYLLMMNYFHLLVKTPRVKSAGVHAALQHILYVLLQSNVQSYGTSLSGAL